MPIINLKVSGEPSTLLLETMVNSLTELTQKHLKKKPEVTAITVSFIPHNQWFIDKKSLEQWQKNSFYLDIKVTDSTNLKDEKAAYIHAVFALISSLLGNIHAKSYVYVEEVKGDAYGYEGLTQEQRYIDNKK